MKPLSATLDLAPFFDESSEAMTEEQMLRLLATAVRDAQESVLITDTELDDPGPRIIFVNPAFTRMTGYEPHEALGKTPRMLQGPKTDRAMLKTLRDTLHKTGRFSAEAVNYHKDGSEYVVEWDIAPVVDAHGTTTHYVSIQRDVTDRKRDEEKLRQTADDLTRAIDEAAAARKAAEAANQAKSQFVANLSHEIRTPMTSIIGFAKVLKDEPDLSDDVHTKVDQIIRSSDHLLTLVNDILDLSKVEAGKLAIEPEPFDFEQVLRDTLAVQRPQAEKAGLTLDLTITNSLPPRVMLDRHRTRQILSNLLSNAIKFTDEGGVRITVTHDSTRGRLTVAVADDGPGIPADQQERIFEAFHQVGSSETERTKGAGLGLAITRHLARAMNGDITVASQPGQGSTFTLDLPAIFLANGKGRDRKHAARPVEPSAGGDKHPLANVSVLAVDDHEANRLLLHHILQRAGAEVVLAEDGFEAVDTFEAKPVDIIVLDVQMPRCDGYETARLIRQLPGGDRVPILMLTAHAMTSDREKSLAAGADGYLSKPFNPSELVRQVRELATTKRRRSDTPPSDPDTATDTTASPRTQASADPEFAALTVEFLEHHVGRLAGYLEGDANPDAVATWAHQLAGAGGSYGFPELTDQARRVERAVKDGVPLATLTSPLREILATLRHRLAQARGR